MSRVCIIIPVFNENETAANTVLDLKKHLPEADIVVVDNNSTDSTSDEVEKTLDPAKDLLVFEPLQGKGYAVKNGLSRIDADIYVIIDGDGTYSGKDARILTDLMISKRVDMVIGDRLSTGAYSRQNKRLGHLLGNSIMTKIISALSGRNYHDVFSGLRVMSRPFVQALEVRSPGFQLETELNVLAAYLKVSVWEVPIDYDARPLNSSSKLSTVKDGTKILSFALNYQ